MQCSLKRLAWSSVAALALFGGVAQAKEITLAILPASMSYPSAVAQARGFTQRAKELGAKAVVVDSKGSTEKMSNDIEDLISQGVSGLAVVPVDSIAAEAYVHEANKQHIPFVAVAAPVGDPNTRPWNDVYPGVSALVSQDDVVLGKLAGQLAVSMLPKGRTAKIAILEGAPGFVAAVQRSQGFLSYLKQSGANYKIVASQPTNWTPEKGEAVCQNMLVANPDVDLIFSHADDMAIGCARAISSSGSHTKLIATSGGSKLGINAIKNGELDGTVCVPWETVGRRAAEALYEAVTKPNTPARRAIEVNTPIVTKATLSTCPPQW